MTSALLAGFVMGAAGSVHCAAMCGPLVLVTAPTGRRAVLHHLGRLTIYALIGVAAGSTGAALVWAGMGQSIAFVAAFVLLWHAAGRLGARSIASSLRPRGRWVTRLTTGLMSWSRSHRVAGPLLVGAMNGLLPCGLVHLAAVTAASLGTAADGALVMLAFGLGTTPVLAGGSAGLASLGARRVARLNRYSPAVMVAIAVLLIVRAVSIGHGH